MEMTAFRQMMLISKIVPNSSRWHHLTMTQLRKYGVTDQTQLKLEYFFYTNAKEKAAALAQKLAELGYAGRYDQSVSDKKQLLVTGWTQGMKMDDQTVTN